MLKEILIVGTGSFAGGVLRYVISKLLNGGFPWGTMIVNISGCLLAGLIFGLMDRGNISSPEMRLLLTAGFCGGYTTFSAFIHENFSMLRAGDYLPFVLYITGSMVLGLAAVWLGWRLVRMV